MEKNKIILTKIISSIIIDNFGKQCYYKIKLN